jgi:hypothetical protein
MADENMTQTGNTGTAPAATDATPAQSGTTDTKTTEQSTTGGISKDWVYNGDRKSVPDPFKNYVSGIDRYWTQKSQAFADYEKKAKEYDSFVGSEDFKTFQQFKAGRMNPTGQTDQRQDQSSVQVTQDEMDAIMLGDPNALRSVVERQAKAILADKEKEFNAVLQSKVEPLARRQKEIDASEMVKQFSELHPDFWELYENGHGEFMLSSLRSGTSLEDAYNKVKAYEANIAARVEEKQKKIIEEKKRGSVTNGTTTGIPDVVYATDERHARRLAIELALKNDPRRVQIQGK